MPKRLVTVGAGGFAEIACAYFDTDSDCDIVTFGVGSAPSHLGASAMNRKQRFGTRAVGDDVYAWMR